METHLALGDWDEVVFLLLYNGREKQRGSQEVSCPAPDSVEIVMYTFEIIFIKPLFSSLLHGVWFASKAAVFLLAVRTNSFNLN